MVPIPATGKNVIAGTRISREETKFIKLGITTRTEVVQHLGTPFSTIETPEAVVYGWNVVTWNYVGAAVTGCPGFYFTYGQLLDRDEVFLLQFDAAHRVQHFEFRHLPSALSVQEFLCTWAAKPK